MKIEVLIFQHEIWNPLYVTFEIWPPSFYVKYEMLYTLHIAVSAQVFLNILLKSMYITYKNLDANISHEI